MNIKQIKEKLTLDTLLQNLGAAQDVKKSKGQDLWYISPLRSNEKTASFHINTAKDQWYDFGLGQGGDLIDFAKAMNEQGGKGSSTAEALEWLRSFVGMTPSLTSIDVKPSKQQHTKGRELADFEIIENRPLSIVSLLNHLDQRKIDRDIAQHYLRQIKFKRPPKDKIIYGYGFSNRAGGYDFSNPLGFKTVLGQKDVCILKGLNRTVLDVFEGASDFLSLLTIEQTVKPPNSSIILNSVSLYEQVIELAKKNEYSLIRFWLDNDEAGRKAFINIKEAFAKEEISPQLIVMNPIYKPHNDLNKWHQEDKRTNSTKSIFIQNYQDKVKNILPFNSSVNFDPI